MNKHLLAAFAGAIALSTASMTAAVEGEGLWVSSGTTSDLQAYRAPYTYEGQPDIVGMGIAGSNDHVYVWYADGTVTSGTSGDLDAYRPSYTYSLPQGKSPQDIVGMGIAGNDHVFAWYELVLK